MGTCHHTADTQSSLNSTAAVLYNNFAHENPGNPTGVTLNSYSGHDP